MQTPSFGPRESPLLASFTGRRTAKPGGPGSSTYVLHLTRQMKLTVTLKLLPSPEQLLALRGTLELANEAASTISATAWQQRTFGRFKLQKLVYASTRARSGLSAQVVVRVIAKVADAYKNDCSRQRRFEPLGSVAYDDRIL